ncbi:gastrula zinc finger protein XlCGF26.1-like [Pieris brassicae]|uniref:gastrula zinc finger protein XlCGF26.1-like n=1 Tax=Pieris brassicae TaxID=7116 RepID=UPI001E65F3B7|nr:gastrula zinc finger protein XlCGF26.1-like [Pieris brassicae]
MESGIMVETLPLFGNCCLCLKLDVVKSMLTPDLREKESYSEMLLKCFSIDISILDLEDTKCLICRPCIDQLGACVKFKELVDTSLKSLEAAARIKEADEDLKKVKEEISNDDASDDDILLCHFKQESNDSNYQDEFLENGIHKDSEDDTRKTRKISKKKKITYSSVCKKVVDLDETIYLLNAGLFPFKMSKDDFSCTICPEKTTTLEDLKTHISQHSTSNIATAFKKMSQSSSQKFSKEKNSLKCKTCAVEIRNFDDMKHHIDACIRLGCRWNQLPFKLEKDQLDCPICKKTFLNFVTLNTHMNEHYPNHTCDNCGKAFASRSRLRGHLRTHEVGSFPCRFCDLVFDKVTKRENHVSKEHKSGIRYVCKRCDISLTSFYARQKHLAEVHNEELKRYKCKACTQSYITPGHLSSHVRRDHLNERNHKCPKCDLAFYTRNSLKMHMIKHDGERIHVCSICSKSYQRMKTLREHMRIHNNDKRFICPVCGRAFTQKCTLKGHLKVHQRTSECV